MNKKIKHHLEDLKNIDAQRKAWLVLSALVIFVLGFVIFDFTRLKDLHLLWTAGVIGITLSVIWWYWAMRIINKVIAHRVEEIEVLSDLCETVKDLKEDVRKNFIKDVD
jgi:hypothetical protein